MPLILLKILLNQYANWNGFINLSDLSLVYTGLFFITGILFSNVNSDLKESERIPAEFVASLEQLEDSYSFMSAKGKNIRHAEIRLSILKTMHLFKFVLNGNEDEATDDMIGRATSLSSSTNATPSSAVSVATDGSDDGAASKRLIDRCFEALSQIPPLASDCNDRGGPGAMFMNGACDKARRAVARANVVARTDVLPSAHGLLQFFVLASTVILFLSTYANYVTLVSVMLSVYTVTWFNVRLISTIDDPFDSDPFMGMVAWFGPVRNIQTFPLDDYAVRVLKRENLMDKIRTPLRVRKYFEDDTSTAETVIGALLEGDFVLATMLVLAKEESSREKPL